MPRSGLTAKLGCGNGQTLHPAPAPKDCPRSRIRGPIGRPQISDPVLEHGQAAVPADPLNDHRRRHIGPLLMQFTDLRLDRVHDRALWRPLVLRRRVVRDRPADGVPRDPQLPCDRPHRHLLGPVKPAELRPVLHADHHSSRPDSTSQIREGVNLQASPLVHFSAVPTRGSGWGVCISSGATSIRACRHAASNGRWPPASRRRRRSARQEDSGSWTIRHRARLIPGAALPRHQEKGRKSRPTRHRPSVSGAHRRARAWPGSAAQCR